MVKVLSEILFTCVASKHFSVEELQAIVNELAIRNKTYGITGCLVYNNREFFQILEGEKETLLALMDSVKDDTRHGNIHIIWNGDIKRRAYKNWGLSKSMSPNIDVKILYSEPTEVISTSKELLQVLEQSINFDMVYH